MLVVAAAALMLSVTVVVSGGAARQIAILPWVVIAILLVGDFLLSFRRPRAVKLDVAPEIFVGETTRLKLEFEAAPANLRVKVDWPEGLEGRKEANADLSRSGNTTVSLQCRAVRRGTWRIEHLWLFWTSRLKFLEFVPRLTVGADIRVVPNIRLVQSGQITTTVVSTLFGVKENRAIGEGSEFHQLRDFVQGMDIKTIDWKRSARRRSLVAKELRAERNHHVVLALDNGYLMREKIGGLPKIDHAVTAALATAWAAAIGGDLVGYFAYDVRPRSFIAPTPGRIAFPRMRSWSAGLDYVSRETNHTLALSELNARTPKRSLIIVFTDFIDTTSAELLIENIGILAKRHMLIFVTIRDPDVEAMIEHTPSDLNGAARLVAADQAIQERRLVLERLARMGVSIVDAKPDTVTARLISTYLEIKARELV